MRRRLRRIGRRVPPAVWLLAAVGAGAAATAGGRPVGVGLADLLLAASLGAIVVLVGAHASWSTLLLGGLVVAAAGGAAPARLAGVAVAVAVVVLERRGRVEPSGAALAALAVVAVALRLPTDGRLGASAGLAALALVPMVVDGWRRLPPLVRRPLARFGVAVAGLAVLGVVVAGAALTRARGDLARGEDQVVLGVEAAQQGDVDAAAEAFRSARLAFASARASTDAWWARPGRAVPVVAQQLHAVDQLAALGGQGAGLALEANTAVDVDGLRLVDGRLDPAAVAAARPVLARLEGEVAALRTRAGALGSPWLAAPVQDRLRRFEGSARRAAASARTASDAAAVAPWVLGAEGRRTYLIAFVTPAEARASGGFMGNYGLLTVDDGRLDLVRVGRDDELDRAGDPAAKQLTGPPGYLARYGRFDPAHTWANVTMSPDFPSVARAMAELYPQSGGVPVDGVLRVDPIALSGLLALTGPITVPGLPEPLDADNVAPFLLAGQYQQFDDQRERTDLLGDVAEVAFDALTTGPAPRPAEVGAALGPALADQDLAVWFRDPAAQAFVERIGADAALPVPDGAGAFGVTTQNASGNKIEAFLQRTVDIDVLLDADTGRARTTVTVALANDAPPAGFPDYVTGNLVGLPPGTNRSYVSLYATQPLVAATLDGRPWELLREVEGGYDVASAFVDVPPQATRTLRLTYAGSVDLAGGRYRFRYLPQVMVRPDVVTWRATVDGGRVAGATEDGSGVLRLADGGVRIRHRASVGPWLATLDLERAGAGG